MHQVRPAAMGFSTGNSRFRAGPSAWTIDVPPIITDIIPDYIPIKWAFLIYFSAKDSTQL